MPDSHSSQEKVGTGLTLGKLTLDRFEVGAFDGGDRSRGADPDESDDFLLLGVYTQNGIGIRVSGHATGAPFGA